MASKTGFTKAFSQVASGTFISRVLGLVREQVFAHLFGATMAADAFFAAFRIPNLLRDLFAEGALSSAFVPVFKQEMKEKGDASAFELASVCFTVLTIVLAVITIVGAAVSPYLVDLVAPGFGGIAGKAELTTRLTVMMFPFLLLVALAALAMSILNSFDKFSVAALAPAMFNVGGIGAAYLICPYLKEPINGMAYGVLLGGLGQFIVQIPGMYRLGFRFRFRPDFKNLGLKRIGKLMTPMVGGLAASRVNILVNPFLASYLSAGAVSYLTYSYRIMHLPLGMIAVALGTVALPKASSQAVDGDQAGLANTFYRSTQLCFFLVFPVAAFFVACGDDVVALLFQHGHFLAEDTAETYRCLVWYGIGLIGFAGVRVTAPVFYALKNASRPMRYSITAVVVNLLANFAMVPFMGAGGLAAATSLGGIINYYLLVAYLPKLVPSVQLSKVWSMFIRSTLASAMIAVALLFISHAAWFEAIGSHFWGRLIRMTVLLVVGTIGYILISIPLRNLPRRDGFRAAPPPIDSDV